MTLRKNAKEARDAEKRKKKEVYYSGERNNLKPNFSDRQRGIIEANGDFVTAIGKELVDYCEFNDTTPIPARRTYGGPIVDKTWEAEVSASGNRIIEIRVLQGYVQPGANLSYGEAEIKYAPGVSRDDINIIRKAITDSGLVRITKPKKSKEAFRAVMAKVCGVAATAVHQIGVRRQEAERAIGRLRANRYVAKK